MSELSSTAPRSVLGEESIKAGAQPWSAANRSSGERLDGSPAERVEVVGVATGDQCPAVCGAGEGLLVHPRPTGVPDVGLQARPARQRLAVEHVCLDEGPGTVADGRDGLLR